MVTYLRKDEGLDTFLDMILHPLDIDLDPVVALVFNQWEDEFPEFAGLNWRAMITEPSILEEIEEIFDEDEATLVPFYYLRSFKIVQTLTNTANFNFITNAAPTFLNLFFEKLTNEVLNSKKSRLQINLDHLGLFLRFFMKSEPITFQAYMLVYNLYFHLAEYLHNHQLREVIVHTLAPSTVFFELTEEALSRYCMYARLSGFFQDLGDKLYAGVAIEQKKRSSSFRPLYLGEITKVIGSMLGAASLEPKDLIEEQKYLLVEERRKFKVADIDLVMKHFLDQARKKPMLFRMKSYIEKLSLPKRPTIEEEKARYPEIFEKLRTSKDSIIFVDYENIKDIEIYRIEGSEMKMLKNPSTNFGSPGKPVTKLGHHAHRSVDGNFDIIRYQLCTSKPRLHQNGGFERELAKLDLESNVVEY